MTKEPDSYYGWWKITTLWIFTIIGAFLALWIGIVLAVAVTTHWNRVNSTAVRIQKRNDAEKAFYALCIRHFNAGDMPSECVPRR